MDLSKETQQRKDFRDILLDLSKSQELLQDPYNRSTMYKRLEALYDAPPEEKHFRHFYSDIFSVLTQVQQNAELGDINILGQNLEVIRNGYNPKNKSTDGRPIDVSDSINKLYDHVSLDIARILYSDAADRRIEQGESIAQVKSEITSLKTNINEVKAELTTTSSTVHDMQKDNVAILGIFAAIVLTFTGGIAFSTSVLQNMHTVSIYRIVLIATIIGIVLLNVIYSLFYYVERIVKNSDKATIRPLIISNVVLFIIIGATITCWACGVTEKHDARLSESINCESSFEEVDTAIKNQQSVESPDQFSAG